MNITFKFIGANGGPRTNGKRLRARRGQIINLYNADEVCESDGNGGLRLKKSPPADFFFKFITIQNHPATNLTKLKNRLMDPIEVNGEPIRRSKWILDWDEFPAPAKVSIGTTGEASINWARPRRTMFKQVTVVNQEDADQDTMGRAATEEELTVNG